MKNWRSRASTGSARRVSRARRIYTARISVRLCGRARGRGGETRGRRWVRPRCMRVGSRGRVSAPYKFVFHAAARRHEGARLQERARAPPVSIGRRRRGLSARFCRALPPVAITDRRNRRRGRRGEEGRAASSGARATQVADPGILLKFHTRRARSKGDRFPNRLLRPHTVYRFIYPARARVHTHVATRARGN